MSPLVLIGILVTCFCAIGCVTVLLLTGPSEETKRLIEVTRAPLRMEDEVPKDERSWATHLLLSTVRFLRLRLGLAGDEKLTQRLVAAGLREPSDVDTYFGIRLLGPVAAVLAGTFIQSNTFFWIFVLMVVAYIAPDLWVSYRTRARRERIRLGLPDALDLMVVCVDAGLGLDQALQRAGQELVLSQPEIADEFMQINLEQRAGKPRVDAWQAMADRTKLDVVRSFAHMLAQTDRFGTPIVRALTSFSDAARTKRRQAAEEMAAKTTVKLVFPLVLFIFPSIFIVLLGPAIISIAQNLGGIFK